MRYATVCSGIEAPTVAWAPLGWKPAWFSEIAEFPSAVLNHHYPNVKNLGDMEALVNSEEVLEHGTINLIAGGTPCQSFSVAGLRKGMADPRGNLALVFISIINRVRPRWILWENVPGVLSSNQGRDFGAFVGALAKCGYGFAYRILNAQYFGAPQRRRRVFLVGYSGDWRPAAAVLFERAGLQGDITPRRKKGERATPSACGGVRAYSERQIAHTLRGEGHDASEDGTGRGVPIIPIDCSPAGISGAVTSKWQKGTGGPAGDEHYNLVVSGINADQEATAFTQNQVGDVLAGDVMPAMGTNQNATGRNTPKILFKSYVRRLTPLECERLQGFPDDYTLIPYKGKPPEACPDAPRYAALGNSMAVPVVRWIGERIKTVEDILNDGAANG